MTFLRALLHWLRRLLRVSGGVATATLLVLLGLLAWLVLTTSGLRSLVGLASELSGGMVTVAQADGRLFGRMTLQGVAVRSDAADVDIAEVELAWIPGYVPALTFYLQRLHLRQVRVALKSTGEEPPATEDSGPIDLSVPLRVVLEDVLVEGLQLTQDGEPLPGAEQIALSGWASHRDLRIEALRVVQPEYGSLSLQARLKSERGAFDIRELVVTGPGTLTAVGRLALDGTASDLQIDWQDLHWPAAAPATERLATSPEGSLRLRGDLADARLDGQLRLLPGGEVRIDGRWQQQEGFTARLDWEALQDPLSAAAMAADDRALPAWTSPSGSLQASGQPDAWQLAMELQARLPALEGVATAANARPPEKAAAPAGTVAGDGASAAAAGRRDSPPKAVGLPLALQLRARGGLQAAEIESLTLSALDGTLRSRAGALRWGPVIGGQLTLEMAGVDPGRLLAEFPGRLNGRLSADFSLPEAGPRAEVQLRLVDSQLRGYRLSLDSRIRLAGESLHLEALDLRSGASRLQGRGRLLPEPDLALRLDSPDLGQLLPDAEGRLALALNARGPLPLPSITVDGDGEALAYAGLRLQQLDLDGNLSAEGFSRLRLAASALNVGGMVIDTLGLSLTGTLESHRLQLDSSLPQGRLAIALAGGADLDSGVWQGSLEALDLRPEGSPDWSLQAAAELSLSAERQRLGRLCLAAADGTDRGSLCLEGEHQDGAVQASYALQDLDLGYLDAFLPAGMTLQGRAEGQGEIRRTAAGVLERGDSALAISEGQLSVPQRPPLRFGPLTATSRVEEQRLALAVDGGLAGGRLEGSVALGLDAEAALRGALQLEIPRLDFLPALTEEVSRADGRLAARLVLAGSLAEPELRASVQLRDGVLVLQGPGLTLEPVTADIESDADGRLALRLSADSDGGNLTVSGTADVFDGPIRASLRVQGQDFQAARLPEVRAWVSPDLRVEVAEAVTVSGEVTIPRARIEPQKFSAAGGTGPHPDQRIVTANGSDVAEALPVRARITVNVGDDVALDGYGLETRLAGTLTVIEEPGRVTRARGALTLEDGRYEAYGQRLAIERGRIVYAGGPVDRPGLDFQAVRTPRPDIRVGIIVRGSIEQPEFQLFSEPAMPQNDQLSWLVLGRPPPGSGQESEEDASALAQAALALGLSGGDWLARNVGSKIGLDEISVGTADGETGEQARLTVGKYIGSRLYISYAVGLFQPGSVFAIRYDLGRGFSLQTEAGVESGGDLFYTLER